MIIITTRPPAIRSVAKSDGHRPWATSEVTASTPMAIFLARYRTIIICERSKRRLS